MTVDQIEILPWCRVANVDGRVTQRIQRLASYKKKCLRIASVRVDQPERVVDGVRIPVPQPGSRRRFIT
jgi:hypothetical protein